MTIKRKLILILSVIGAILFALAGFLTWNAAHMFQQVRTIDSSLDVLESVRDIRSQLFQQEHALIHYLALADRDARNRYEALGCSLETALERLQGVLRESRRGKADAATGAVDDLINYYPELFASGAQLLSTREAGSVEQVGFIMELEVEPVLESIVQPKLDAVIQHEIGTIRSAYHKLLMGTGALPWARPEGGRRIAMAESTIDYFWAVHRAELAIYQLMQEFGEHMVTGSQEDLAESQQAGQDLERIFEEWEKIISVQHALGVTGEEEDAGNLHAFRGHYYEITAALERASLLHKAGEVAAAINMIEEQAMPPFDRKLHPLIEAISEESRGEVEEAHGSLIRTVVAAGILGIVMLGIVSAVILAIILRLIRSIIAPLERLKRGTEIIGAGNLDHRIAVASGDELGELSASFNRMTESLRESTEELKSFSYIVSHDLRAPLVNIRGFAMELRYALKDVVAVFERSLAKFEPRDHAMLATAFKKEVPEALGFIESSVTRMDGLINAILKLSRMGRSAPRYEPVDLKGLAGEILATMAHQIEQKRVQVDVGALPVITADRTALEQVLGNLIDNAVKYLDPARPGLLEIAAETKAGETVVHVRDNGQGIAREDQKRIFEIFQRAGRQDVPGEGMGLPYVKAMIKRHGGRIWCESVPGVGSTFSFAIPQRAEKPEMDEGERADT